MKKIIFSFIGVLLFGQIALAQSEFANINQGDYRLGGTVGLGYSTYSSTILSLNPTVQYFVVDRFALGLAIDYFTSNSGSTLDIGPVLSWHFWQNEKCVTYLEEKLMQLNAIKPATAVNDSYWVSQTTLGLNYFIVPQVAFGPALTFQYYLDQNRFQNSNSTTLIGSFSIFL